jgi:replicative DNA helicase
MPLVPARPTEIPPFVRTPGRIDASASLSPLDIRPCAKRIPMERSLAMMVIDDLQLLISTRRQDNRQQEVSEISRDLKIFAEELNAPVLALSQLNRAVESRHPPVRQLSDLRDSGAVEQDTAARLLLAKQRNGRLGEVPLRFDRACVRFDPLAYTPHYQVRAHGSNRRRPRALARAAVALPGTVGRAQRLCPVGEF